MTVLRDDLSADFLRSRSAAVKVSLDPNEIADRAAVAEAGPVPDPTYRPSTPLEQKLGRTAKPEEEKLAGSLAAGEERSRRRQEAEASADAERRPASAPARRGESSISEAVRDADSGARLRKPALPADIVERAGKRATSRITDAAEGRGGLRQLGAQAGINIPPSVEAALEALNLPSTTVGKLVGELLQANGVDVDTASIAELAAEVGAGVAGLGMNAVPTMAGALFPLGTAKAASSAVRLPRGDEITDISKRASDFRLMIQSGDRWAILSAEKAGLPEAENAARIAALEAEIRRRGFEPIPALGRYGGNDEHSFVVPGLSPDEALELGRRFQQESVLTPQGLFYTADRSVNPADPFKTGFVTEPVDAKPSAYSGGLDHASIADAADVEQRMHDLGFTEVVIGGDRIKFTVPIDFERKLSADEGASMLALERYMKSNPGDLIDPANVEHRAGLIGGQERRRLAGDPNAVPRLHYYTQGTEPEAGIRAGQFKVTTQVPEARVYDLGTDPLGFVGKTRDINEMERMIRDAGFAGYRVSTHENPTMANVVAMFEPARPTAVEDLWNRVPGVRKLEQDGTDGLRGALGLAGAAALVDPSQEPGDIAEAGIAYNLPLLYAAGVLRNKTLPRRVQSALASWGAAKIFRGAGSQKAFREAMTKEFGPDIEDHLPRLYEQAKKQFQAHLKGMHLGSVDDTVRFFHKGSMMPDWYGTSDELVEQFGPDAELVAGLIAATSAHTPVEKNVELALHAYSLVKTGDYSASVYSTYPGALPAHIPNIDRAINGLPLSGNKVESFRRNILGNEDIVTVDTHMAQVLFKEKPDPLHDALYATGADYVRRLAAKLGVTPRYAQQAIWVGKKLEDGLKEGEILEPLMDTVRRKLAENSVFDFFGEMAKKGLDERGMARTAASAYFGNLVLGAALGTFAGPGQTTEERIQDALLGAGLGVGLTRGAVRRMAEIVNDEAGALFPGRRRMMQVRPITEAEGKFILEGRDPIKPGIVYRPDEIIVDSDTAVKINWEDFNADPEAFPNLIRRVVKLYEDRGVIHKRPMTHEEIGKLAEITGIEPARLLDAVKVGAEEGSRPALNRVQLRALMDVTGTAFRKLEQYQGAMLSGFHQGEDAVLLEQKFLTQAGVAAEFASRLTEAASVAGGALNILQSEGRTYLAQANKLLELMEMHRAGKIDVRRFAELSATLDEASRPTFLRQVLKHAETTGNFLLSAWYNALLSNPATHAANILSNTVTTMLAPFERTVAGAIGGVRDIAGLVNEGDRVFMGEGVAQVVGAIHGFLDAVLASGKTMWTGSSRFGRTAAKEAAQITPEVMDAAGVFGHVASMLWNGPTRALMAEDEFFKVLNHRMELWAQAYREARIQGKTGSDLRDFIAGFVKDPDSKYLLMAEQFAHYQTFTTPLTGRLGSIQHAVSHPLARVAVPFFQTPVNLFRFNFERLPVLGAAVQSWRADFAAGGARRDLALAKQAVGGLVLATAAYLVMNGHIVGPGPLDPDLNREWQDATGAVPNSIRVGNRYFQFNRLDAYGQLFATVAGFVDIAGYLEADSLAELGTALAITFANNFLDKTYMEGLREVFNTILVKKPQDIKTHFFEKLVENLWPYAGLMGQLNRTTGIPGLSEPDPLVRDAQTLLEHWMRKTPWGSKDIKPKRNVFGEPVFYKPGYPVALISPIAMSESKSDPASRALFENNVDLELPERSILGPKPPMVGPVQPHHGIPLNSDQYDKLVRLAGNEMKLLPADDLANALGVQAGEWAGKKLGFKDAVTMIATSPAYRTLTKGPDGAFAEKLIKPLAGAFRKAAKAELIAGDAELRLKFRDKTLDRVEALGGPDLREQAKFEIDRALSDLSQSLSR